MKKVDADSARTIAFWTFMLFLFVLIDIGAFSSIFGQNRDDDSDLATTTTTVTETTTVTTTTEVIYEKSN